MAAEEITQIVLDGVRVGIQGLREAIEALPPLAGRPEEEIGQALLAAVQRKNYIPAGAREQYRQALIREYKKARGETVAAGEEGLSLKILGPGCASCQALVQLVMDVLAEMQLPGRVEHLTDLREIARLGFMSLPALLINGEPKVVGGAPSRAQLKQWLMEAEEKQKNKKECRDDQV